MPSARIEIENQYQGWHAELEVGGAVVQRRSVHAVTFDDIIGLVIDAYHELSPRDEKKVPPVPDQPLVPVAMPAGMKRRPGRPKRGERGQML